MEEDYDDDSIPESEFGKLSKFNSAGIVNSTLNNLWIDFFRHFRTGRFLSANADLDCIWTILGGEKGLKAGGATETKYKAIEKKLAESGTLGDSLQIKGFGSVEKAHIDKLVKQKGILLEKSMYLRRLQNAQGKGTSYDEGEDEELN